MTEFNYFKTISVFVLATILSSSSGLCNEPNIEKLQIHSEIRANSLSESRPFIISGAGIAGLALAYLFKKNNIPYIILDRDPKPNFRNQGYALNITPEGQEIVKKMGLYPDLVEHSIPLSGGIQTHDTAGKIVSTKQVTLPNLASSLAIPRGKLRDLLLKKVGENNVKWGARVTAFDKTGDNRVKVKIKEADGKEYEMDGTSVIGADGINSQIRKLVVGDEKHPLGVVSIYGLSSKPSAQQFQVIDKNKRFFGKPFSTTEFNWQMSFACHDIEVPETPVDALSLVLSHVKDWDPSIKTLVESTSKDTVTVSPLSYRDQLEKNLGPDLLATLIGDAAHPMAPFGGPRGANLALEDAFVLEGEIEKHWPNVTTAFRSFEEKMYERTKVLVESSKKAAWRIHGIEENFTPSE